MKETNYKWSMSLIIFSLTIYSCSFIGADNHLKTSIEETFNNCSDKNNCTIDLSSELEFKWDTMYVFGINATPRFVSNSIGIEYAKSKDLTRVILFTYDEKIVEEIRDKLDPEKPYEFRFIDEQRKFSNDSAVFIINKTIDNVFELSLKTVTQPSNQGNQN